MLAASNISRITRSKSSFSFGVSSHLVRGSLSFTSSSASIFSLFGFICVRQGQASVSALRRSANSHGVDVWIWVSVGQGSLQFGFVLVCSCRLQLNRGPKMGFV